MKHRQPKDITIGLPARQRVINGALKAARAITTTYGPLGRTAMLQRMSGLLTTKDGVTVARELAFSDPLENMGCRILKEACITVNNQTGDGTTTAALLAAAILREGHKHIVAGADPGQLARDLQAAGAEAVAAVRQLAVPVKNQAELEQVAQIACNGDEEIARLMAEACMAVGKDGTLLIEDGQSVDSKLEFKEGMELERGPASRAFLKGLHERVMDAAIVAVVNFPLRRVEDVQSILETASQWPDNPLILFALDVDGDALRTMVLNDGKNVVKSCAFSAPGFMDRQAFLKDVAAMAGARFVDPVSGDDIRDWQGDWFGAYRRAIIKATATTITAYDDKQSFIDARLRELRQEEPRCTSDFDRDRIKERMAKLSGGLAILKIGGVSEAAMKERRARVEDALGATRAALKGGIVPGGGKAYLAVAGNHPILSKALQRPLGMHVEFAGGSGQVVIESIPDSLWDGWDASQGRIRDLRDTPLIADPALVVENAITAAVSVASTLLTVEACVFKA